MYQLNPPYSRLVHFLFSWNKADIILPLQMKNMVSVTFAWPVQLCFSVEQHVRTLFALELLLYVRLPDGGHRGVIKVKPVATLLIDRKIHREKQASE